ncbi:hypothetical protein CRM22_010187 [Opisthorchis felineus]|uniref:Major facilitator superfamily (MFS) profile domain-containing protein n=1 Tax=Opisthorchis felineus TaxID=147828 RepID=A0A4S2L194_OPIFE|nr:hypothetical protein CRM22_010187 [Opisthorchis felineus]
MDPGQNFAFDNRSERNIKFGSTVSEFKGNLAHKDQKGNIMEPLRTHANRREAKNLTVSLPNAQMESIGLLNTGLHHLLPTADLYSRVKQNHMRRTHSDGDIRQESVPIAHSFSPPYSNFARYLPCLSTPTESSTSSFASLPVSGSVLTSDSSFRLPISASQLSLPEAPDGGWGWVIVFAAFMVHMITEGVIVSFGIFIEDLAEEFEESMSATSWVGSFSYGIPALVTPVSSFFLNRFGCRITCMLGALISALGCLAGCFTNSLLALVFTFGILSGLGSSLSMTAALVIVSLYFDDRRATATGLSIAGTGVGALVFAPAVEFFINIYTWRGTFMLMAGALLHIAICGALMRPVETDMERRLRQRLAWLEHFAKESGLPPLSKTADYIDSDVPGRIKLLRDSLLATNKSSGRAHAVVRIPNDVCSRPHMVTQETYKPNLPPLSGYTKNEKLLPYSVSPNFCDDACRAKEKREGHSAQINQQNGWIEKVVKLEPVPEYEPIFPTVIRKTEHSLNHPRRSNYSYLPNGAEIPLKSNRKNEPVPHFNATLTCKRGIFYSTFHISKCGISKHRNLTKSGSVPDFPYNEHKNFGMNSDGTTPVSEDDADKPVTFDDKNACLFSHMQSKEEKPMQPENTDLSRFQDSHLGFSRRSDVSQKGVALSNLTHVPTQPGDVEHKHCGRMDVFYRAPLLKAFGITPESLCRALSLPDLSQVHRIRRRSGSVGSSDSSSLEESCISPNVCGCIKRDASGQDDVPCEDCFIIFPLTQLLNCCGLSMPDLSGRHLCKQLCDLRLCRHYNFDLFIFSNVLLYFWYNVTYFFLGVHALDLGFSETQAALLFSVLGGANMVGEVVVGFLADREWVDALMLYLIMLLACGISTTVVPLLASFLSLSSYASVFGFGLASNDALCTILLVEFVGLHHLTNALGMCFFCQGVANIIGPPTIGFIIDSTGSQNLAFFISGVGLILSGLVVVPIIVDRFRRRRARRLRRHQQQEQLRQIQCQPQTFSQEDNELVNV